MILSEPFFMMHCIIVDINAIKNNGIPDENIVELISSYKKAPYGTNSYTYEDSHNIIIIGDNSAENWLEDNNIKYDILYKDELNLVYNKYIKDKYHVDFILVNNINTFNELKSLGLTALLV